MLFNYYVHILIEAHMISKRNELHESFDEDPLRKQRDIYLDATRGVKHGHTLRGLKMKDVYGSTSS